MDEGLGSGGVVGAAGAGEGTVGGAGFAITGRRRGLVTAAALALSLAGVLVFLLMIFQPFADAAGGCGGG